MDTDEPFDADVVRLRREGEPDDAERQRLADTIFAAEDEVGPFSRGNLVPPKPEQKPEAEPAPKPDPFFEKIVRERAETASDDDAAAADDATAAYFDQLASQTPAELSESQTPPTPAPTLAGSASSVHRAQPRERRARREGGLVRRVRAPSVALVVAGFAVAGVAAASIPSGSAPRSPAADASRDRSSIFAGLAPSLTTLSHLRIDTSPVTTRHVARTKTRRPHRRSHKARSKVVLAADHLRARRSTNTPKAAPSESTTTSTLVAASTNSTAATYTSPQPAVTPAATAHETSGGSTHHSSGAAGPSSSNPLAGLGSCIKGC